MVKPPAYKLPHLLALLPRSGKSSLVRKVDWPANSFYKVTDTKLKFREGADESVKAGGKAWGMLFWKGKLVPPRKNAPAPQIRGALKHLWAEVPVSSLSEAEQKAIAEGEAVVKEMKERSVAELAERRARNLQLLAARAEEIQEKRDERIAAAHKDD